MGAAALPEVPMPVLWGSERQAYPPVPCKYSVPSLRVASSFPSSLPIFCHPCMVGLLWTPFFSGGDPYL